MTDFTKYRSRTRDIKDGAERGVWGVREDVDGAGSIMSVRGTGTTDYELPIFNFGYSFNLSENADAEVIMMSLGSDVNDKIAIPQLPRSAQRQWPENTGGIQHPSDGERYVEFNAEETHLNDGTFVVGSNREVVITVDGTNVVITTDGDATVNAAEVNVNATDVNITGNLNVTGNVATTGSLTNNGTDVGSGHTHSGVSTGAGNTGAPV